LRLSIHLCIFNHLFVQESLQVRVNVKRPYGCLITCWKNKWTTYIIPNNANNVHFKQTANKKWKTFTICFNMLMGEEVCNWQIENCPLLDSLNIWTYNLFSMHGEWNFKWRRKLWVFWILWIFFFAWLAYFLLIRKSCI